MKVDNVGTVGNSMDMQMLTQIFENNTDNSESFQMVMESLVKAMEDKGKPISGMGLGELNTNTSSTLNSGSTNINNAVTEASNKYKVDKDLINAVINQESSFNPQSTSSSGAMGLMQLMPDTAKDLGVTNPYDIQQNVDGGTKYLKSLLDMYGNSKELALSAYNAGAGTVNSRGVKDKNDIDKLPSETRDYVKKVMKYYGK